MTRSGVQFSLAAPSQPLDIKATRRISASVSVASSMQTSCGTPKTSDQLPTIFEGRNQKSHPVRRLRGFVIDQHGFKRPTVDRPLQCLDHTFSSPAASIHFFITFREYGHAPSQVIHHVFDREVKYAKNTWHKRFHKIQMEDVQRKIDEAGAVTADLLTWHSTVG